MDGCWQASRATRELGECGVIVSAHDVTEPCQQSTEQSVLMATIQAYTFYYPFYRSRNGAPEKRTVQVHTGQISVKCLTAELAELRRQMREVGGVGGAFLSVNFSKAHCPSQACP